VTNSIAMPSSKWRTTVPRILPTSSGDPTGGLLSPFVLPQRDVIAGIALMAAVGVAAGLLPATGAMRIKITDALRKT